MPKRSADQQSDSPGEALGSNLLSPNAPRVPRNSMEQATDASKINEFRASLQSSLQSVTSKLNEVKGKDHDQDVAMQDNEDEPADDKGDEKEEEKGEQQHQAKKIRTHAEEGAGSGRYDPYY